jgi:hypothetical protein
VQQTDNDLSGGKWRSVFKDTSDAFEWVMDLLKTVLLEQQQIPSGLFLKTIFSLVEERILD